MAVIIIKSNDWPRETHVHLCVYCKRTFFEPNELCQKTLKGTGLDYHRYPCLRCSADIRRRLGSDWIDAVFETVMDRMGAARLLHVWPDAKVDAREEAEAARGNTEIAAVLDEAKKI